MLGGEVGASTGRGRMRHMGTSGLVEVGVGGQPLSLRAAWVGQDGLDCVADSVFSLPLSPSKGELYFMSTGVPSATAARGVIYKVIDPSR